MHRLHPIDSSRLQPVFFYFFTALTMRLFNYAITITIILINKMNGKFVVI